MLSGLSMLFPLLDKGVYTLGGNPSGLSSYFLTGTVLGSYHFVLSAQYAADILPLDMLDACRALKDSRRFR